VKITIPKVIYAVTPRGDWLDLTHKVSDPIAWFVYEKHAIDYGNRMWGKFYTIKKITFLEEE